MSRRIIYFVSLLTALSVPASSSTASAGMKPWIEIRSPHFRVLTDGTERDGRRVAFDFEEMRYVFSSQFPSYRMESGAPLLVLAPRDLRSAEILAPGFGKGNGENVVGFFFQRRDERYALVRLDLPYDAREIAVFNAYTHSILHMNFHWLPRWLDDGIAEFYGATVFKPNQIIVGSPTMNFETGYHEGFYTIPVEKLIAMNPGFIKDLNKQIVFYGESWALVHYMMFGSGMQGGVKIKEFFNLSQSGVEQKAAFVQAFGDFKTVDDGLHAYMEQQGFVAAALPGPPAIDEDTFSAMTLTVAETEAELAGFELAGGANDEAIALAAQALHDDPKLGLAHEQNGFLLLLDGKNAEAADEFSKAYALDPSLYLSLFAKTMLSPTATSDAPSDQDAFRMALTMVVQLDPQFAPAFVQMARLAVRKGNLKEALRLSLKAEEFDPWLAGYHVQTGQILLRLGRDAEAAEIAQYVAQNWTGADHNEAVELWNDVPADQRPAVDPPKEERPDNTQQVEGAIKSTNCDHADFGKRGKDELSGFVLTVDHAGETLTFRLKGYMRGGYSDTLWNGDHFQWCHNVDGFRAVVNFRPPSNLMYSGDLASVELRNDLPPSPPLTAPSPTPAATPPAAPTAPPLADH